MSDQSTTVELPARLTTPDITPAQQLVLAISDVEHAARVVEDCKTTIERLGEKADKALLAVADVEQAQSNAVADYNAAQAALTAAHNVLDSLAPAAPVEDSSRTAGAAVGAFDAAAETTPNPDFHKAG